MRNSIFKSYTKKILRSEAFISVIIVFVLALGIIGTSYALYMDVDTDTNYQLVEVGDLSIGFDNGENTITLENMTPMEDELALKESGNIFSFYIYNTGTYTADYEIKLVPDNTNGNTIAPEYINYQICKDNAENCTEVKTLGTNSLIYTDALSPKRETDASNPSAYYFLRLWINNTYTETNGGTIKYNVEISAKNSSGYLDNENTLAGAILNNPNITINNTEPIFNTTEVLELGLFKAEDDYGVSYYFRGAQSNNYVNFAGFTWRVVRINGDGSIRLILDGTLDNVKREGLDNYAGSESVFNSKTRDNAYVGYMYGLAGITTDANRCLMLINGIVTDKVSEYNTKESCEQNGGKWTTTAYEATHANVESSTIKQNLDTFYEAYIESDTNDYHFGKYLADSIICGDKTLAADGIGEISKQLGYGEKQTKYAAYERLIYSSEINPSKKTFPTLKCAEGANNNYSRYTVDSLSINGVDTNGDLTYPIGLLSADEFIMAGAFYNLQNKKNYLYNSSVWWNISPASVGNAKLTLEFRSLEGGLVYLDVNSNSSIRPVINLKKDVLISGGNGTQSTPYTINYN